MFDFLKKVLNKDEENEFEKELNNNQYYQPSISVSNDDTGNFKFIVDTVFNFFSSGTVVTGNIISGTIYEGDIVKIFDEGGNYKLTTTISGINVTKENITSATAGNKVELHMKGVDADNIERFDVISK